MGNKSPPKQQPQPNQKKIKQNQLKKSQETQVNGQKAVFNINQSIKRVDEQINKLTFQIQTKTARAKQYMDQGQKKKAKTIVQDITNMKKTLDTLSTRKKVLIKQKNQLQVAVIDVGLVNTMEDANKFMANTQQANDRLQQVLLDQQQIQANQNQTNQMMKQLAGMNDNEQQENELFNELQKQVNMQKGKKITQELQKSNNIKVKVNKVEVKKQEDNMDEIARMLNS